MAVSRYEKQIRGNPGHRAGDAHRYISKHRHQAKAHKGARCHLAYPGNNGQPGIPKSLYHEPHRIDKDKRNIEQAVADEEQTRVPQDFPFPLIHKHEGNPLPEDTEHCKGYDGIDAAHDSPSFQALVNTVQLPGPHILSAEGGHGGSQGVKGTAEEHADFAACRHRGHCHGAQGIDCGLQDYTSYGGDGILQPHGNSHVAQNLHIMGIRPPLVIIHLKNGKFLFHVQQAQDS